jgi:hypothetical protein
MTFLGIDRHSEYVKMAVEAGRRGIEECEAENAKGVTAPAVAPDF